MAVILRLELSAPGMPIVRVDAVGSEFKTVTQQDGSMILHVKIKDEHGREGYITIDIDRPRPLRRLREPLNARL
jgi:hypothetical protein